jgi:hypothetical protein
VLLLCCATTGEGLTVTEYRMGADNRLEQGATFKHTILLSGVFGDSPAIKKLAHWLSHAAYLGCGYCTLWGTVGEGGKGMYFPGYVNGTSFGVFRPKEVQRYGAHSDFRQGVAEPGAEEVTLVTRSSVIVQKRLMHKRVFPQTWGAMGPPLLSSILSMLTTTTCLWSQLLMQVCWGW